MGDNLLFKCSQYKLIQFLVFYFLFKLVIGLEYYHAFRYMFRYFSHAYNIYMVK